MGAGFKGATLAENRAMPGDEANTRRSFLSVRFKTQIFDFEERLLTWLTFWKHPAFLSPLLGCIIKLLNTRQNLRYLGESADRGPDPKNYVFPHSISAKMRERFPRNRGNKMARKFDGIINVWI
jgi:hypothetical protein